MATAASAQELNIYSSRQEFLSKPFIEQFERDTGTKVNIVYVQRGLIERLKAEGDNSPADLVMTVDIAQIVQIAEAGVFRAVASPAIDKSIPSQYHGPEGIWYGLTSRARVIYASKDRVKPGEIATYEDLADPKWKGRICTRSGYHEYQLSLLASIVAHRGEAAAEAWLRGLKANLARKPQGSDRSQVQAIKEGVCDVSLGNTYYMGLMRQNPKEKEWADAVNIIFPNQGDRGTHVNISAVGVTKSSKNPALAVKFIEFLSSDAAQKLYAEQNLEYPVKPGIALHPEVASWGTFRADTKGLGEVSKLVPVAAKIVDRVKYDE